MKKTVLPLIAVMSLAAGCGKQAKNNTDDRRESNRPAISHLRHNLQAMADSWPGEIGVAVITDRGDTLTVNDEAKYPLMSVFKLHQAISLCDLFERTGLSLDSVVSIPRSELNPDTWSPMLKDHTADTITLPIRSLLTYTLTLSDNNASNWIFEHLQPVAHTDSFIATVIPRESFSISHTEAEMGLDHKLAYENRSSPLGAAMLINRLYTDSILSETHTNFIRATLDGCQTGQDRIAAPLEDIPRVTLGHKTGSGYRNEDGVLAAHNDVGFVRLPDGHSYSLAVFVKDFKGNESEAAAAIAGISETVYSCLAQ